MTIDEKLQHFYEDVYKRQLRSSLEQKKNEELSELRSQMESALCELDSYYSQNHETLSEHLFRKLLAN